MLDSQLTRGRYLAATAGIVALPLSAHAQPLEKAAASGQIETDRRFMRMALDMGRRNPRYPYGAVIVETKSGAVLARGVNAARTNPMLHGEIAAMNDYLARHGNHNWSSTTLYTTAEPCAMCAGAIVWAGIHRTVYGTSIASLVSHGVSQLQVRMRDVLAAAPFYHGTLTGGVLAELTDKTFF